MLEKEHPQLSPKIHGMWHHLLADWDQVLQEVLWNMEQGRTSNTMRCGAFFNEVRPLFMEVFGLDVEEELSTMATQTWAEGTWMGKWHTQQEEAWQTIFAKMIT